MQKPKSKQKKKKTKPQSGHQSGYNILSDTRLVEANAIIAAFQQGNLGDMQQKAQQFCRKYPDVAFGWKMLGTAAGILHQHTEALTLLDKAAALNPSDPDVFKFLGNVHKDMGQLDKAIAAFKQAIRLKPDFAEAYNNLGVTLHDAERDEEAMVHYAKALALAPQYPEALNNMGISLAKCGRDAEAVSSYEKALAINPNYVQAYANLGISLVELGNHAAAIERYKTAIQINPNYAEAYNNLGYALQELGHFDEATTQFREALIRKPGYAAPAFNLGNIAMHYGLRDEAIAHYTTALRYQPTSTAIFDIYYIVLNSIADKQQVIFEACRKFYDQFPQFDYIDFDPSRYTQKTNNVIRIGYVSGDFNNDHPLHFFMQGVLQHHDSQAFEIFCYTTSAKHDAFTESVQAQIGHWRSLVGLSDDAACRLIRSDAIDILVDLSGHTKNNRLGVFARKPAPIQVTWLGFLNTTGLRTMDYMLCNRWMVTEEDRPYCSEEPWYLEGPGSCFVSEALDGDPPLQELPALRNGFVTFGSCNNFYKITDTVLQCWIDILHAVPGSRLFCKAKVFENASIGASFLEKFTAAGIDASRITLEGPTAFAGFLEAQQHIDINLDTFPYNGGTVTCHSLSMGVPVLTLRGASVIAHVGESFLRPLGLETWIAEDTDAYVAAAVAWAGRLDELAGLRRTLRGRFKAVYGDAAAFTQRLEAAYAAMWAKWRDATPRGGE